MKNLKKLTRKGLDELANEMPQVNEIQQRECVGGYVYYVLNEYGSINPSQHYTVGPASDEIRIATSSEMGTYWESNTNTPFGTPLFEYGSNVENNLIYKILYDVPSCSGINFHYITGPYGFDLRPNQNGIVDVYIPSLGTTTQSDIDGRAASLNAYFNSGWS